MAGLISTGIWGFICSCLPTGKQDKDGKPIYAEHFLSGFAGWGWKIWKTVAGFFRLEIDELVVRRTMTVFELLIQKIRAIKGAIAITQANGKIKTAQLTEDGTAYLITLEENDMSFVEYDYFRCQEFNGGQKFYHVEIESVSEGFIRVPASEFTSSVPEPGDEIVQFGNSSRDAKHAGRHSAIYMHVDDGEPALDLMTDIYSKDWSNVVTTRLGGNLPGTDGKRGLYSVNGKIFAVDTFGNKIYEINPDGSGMFGFGAFSFSKDGIVFSKDAKITWNNFIDEYITDGTTIGNKFVASPTGFFGSKGSNGKLTGVLMGKNVAVNGVTRTGIFALVDDIPVFELDPITKKYKFEGEIKATSGTIGSLKIEENTLTNTDGTTRIELSDGKRTLNLVGDSSLVGANLGVGATNMKGIGIGTNATCKNSTALEINCEGDTNTAFRIMGNNGKAIDMYGAVTMIQRDKETWDVAGPLFAASVAANGTNTGTWGQGLRYSGSGRSTVGKYYINHNLGHTDYYVSLTCFNSNRIGTILSKTNTQITIGFLANDNNQFSDTDFEIIVIGRNKYT